MIHIKICMRLLALLMGVVGIIFITRFHYAVESELFGFTDRVRYLLHFLYISPIIYFYAALRHLSVDIREPEAVRIKRVDVMILAYVILSAFFLGFLMFETNRAIVQYGL